MNFYAQVAGLNLPSNFVFKVGKKFKIRVVRILREECWEDEKKDHKLR